MKKLLTIFAVLGLLCLANMVLFPDASASEKQDATIQNTVETERSSGGLDVAIKGLKQFYTYTGIKNATPGHLVMILIGLFFIFLAIRFDYEPLLLIPIGTGIIIGNIPFFQAEGVNMQLGIYEEGSVLNYLYFGVLKGDRKSVV